MSSASSPPSPPSPSSSFSAMHTSRSRPAVEALKGLLNQTLRISCTDNRVFVGTFLCVDKQLNVILGNTDEYSPGKPEGRYVTMVMVPWRLVAAVAVHDDETIIGLSGKTKSLHCALLIPALVETHHLHFHDFHCHLIKASHDGLKIQFHIQNTALNISMRRQEALLCIEIVMEEVSPSMGISDGVWAYHSLVGVLSE